MKFLVNIKDKIVGLWNRLPDGLKRIVHTLWQAVLAALLVGITAAHSSHDVQSALMVVYTAGWAALKASLLKLAESKVEG